MHTLSFLLSPACCSAIEPACRGFVKQRPRGGRERCQVHPSVQMEIHTRAIFCVLCTWAGESSAAADVQSAKVGGRGKLAFTLWKGKGSTVMLLRLSLAAPESELRPGGGVVCLPPVQRVQVGKNKPRRLYFANDLTRREKTKDTPGPRLPFACLHATHS